MQKNEVQEQQQYSYLVHNLSKTPLLQWDRTEKEACWICVDVLAMVHCTESGVLCVSGRPPLDGPL